MEEGKQHEDQPHQESGQGGDRPSTALALTGGQEAGPTSQAPEPIDDDVLKVCTEYTGTTPACMNLHALTYR
jgi:hypothetical protein